MSIIEKAIEKLQGESKPRPQPQLGTRTTSNRKTDGRLAASAGDRPTRMARSSVVSFRIELPELRAVGLVPEAAASDRSDEEFRRIKRPLLEGVLDDTGAVTADPWNVIMIASSVAGEGKTYVSFNLARSITRERDLSVLLIDADVAKRHLTSLLKVEGLPGLTNALVNDEIDPESLVLGTNIPGLTFLSAGSQTKLAPELFSSQRMAEIVSRLGSADRRRVILFDSSPLLATSESPILAKLVDQVVMVVSAESTEQPVVLEALSSLQGARSVRCVLNRSRVSPLAEHYYGYYSQRADTP